MKSLSFKKVPDEQSDIRSTIKYVFMLLQSIVRSQKNWNWSLYWCFLIVSSQHVLPTPWLSIQYTPDLIAGKIVRMVLGLILLLYRRAIKTWLKNNLHFTFWDRIFARVRFYKSSFFIPSFRHQDSNSYYLVVTTAKIPKPWKRTSLDVYFSIWISQDRAINCQ